MGFFQVSHVGILDVSMTLGFGCHWLVTCVMKITFICTFFNRSPGVSPLIVAAGGFASLWKSSLLKKQSALVTGY